MELMEIIAKRRSIRGFKPDPIKKEDIDYILNAGRLAPSACNFQPWHFIVISGNSVKSLKSVYSPDWFTSAPVIIGVCVDKTKSWKRSDGKSAADVDGAIAMTFMMLAATEIGLGTCWVGAFKADEAKKELNLPDHIELIALTPLGYPEGIPPAKPRKELRELIHKNKFGQ
jgi:nitroreductase